MLEQKNFEGSRIYLTEKATFVSDGVLIQFYCLLGCNSFTLKTGIQIASHSGFMHVNSVYI